MSLSEGYGGLSAADVAAVTGNCGNNGNDGMFNGNGAWWLIILLLFANGRGFGGFGGYGGGMMPMMPWVTSTTTQNDVQRGFDQSAIISGLNGITSAVSNGFSNAEISRCNGQTNILQAMNTNQASTVAGINSLATALQNCCCENRAGIADLKYVIANENCADRVAVSDGIRDLMAANTANTQALVNSTNAGFQGIMEKICQLELAGKNQQIADLQSALNEANRRASQTEQTAQILASQSAQTAALQQYLRPTPNPAYIVQNPNCCPSQNFSGCGCGFAA